MAQSQLFAPLGHQQASQQLAAQTNAEINVQLAAARQFPRSVDTALNRILTIATLDEETASECFYSLRRASRQGPQTIEGVSVRMAEIIAAAWGNLRVITDVVDNNGRTITARAVCHDLETNYAVALTVQRSILDSYGRPYSQDMQVLTGNAAMAIAFRNAVLKVVPKAVTSRVVNQIRQVAAGKLRDLSQSRRAMVDYFQGLGVSPDSLLAYLGVTTLDAIDARTIMELRGLANAIKEGTATIEGVFPQPQPSAAPTTARRLIEKSAAAKARADAANASRQAADPAAKPSATGANTVNE